MALHVCRELIRDVRRHGVVRGTAHGGGLGSDNGSMGRAVRTRNSLRSIIALVTGLQGGGRPLLRYSIFVRLGTGDGRGLGRLRASVTVRLAHSGVRISELALERGRNFLSIGPVNSGRFKLLCREILPTSSITGLFPFGFDNGASPGNLCVNQSGCNAGVLISFSHEARSGAADGVLVLKGSNRNGSCLLGLVLAGVHRDKGGVLYLSPRTRCRSLAGTLNNYCVSFVSNGCGVGPLRPGS